MTIIFLLIVSFLVYFQYRIERNIINLISILMAPYAIIVFFNNFFFYKAGFYKIGDFSLFIILCAFVIFFIGSRFAFKIRKNSIVSEEEMQIELEKYNIKKIRYFLTIIGILGLLKLLDAVVSGKINSEGYMGNGIVGHLLLLSYSLVPILFLSWTYNVKQINNLLITGIIVVISFSSFVKYNVISMVVVIFLFVTMARKTLVRKGIALLVALIAVLFILNYAIGFYLQQVKAPYSFYLNHFWTYCGGTLINSNNYYAGEFSEKIGIMYKLMVYLCALPNMFLSKININIFPWDKFDYSPYLISDNNQYTNVIDAVTRLYPANGNWVEIVFFFLLMFFMGFLFMGLYIKWKKRKLSPTLPIFLTFFVFFSFFGTFYMLAAPWETLVWSLFVPNFFKRKKIKTVIYS